MSDQLAIFFSGACHDLAKQLSYYLYFFFFLFFSFSYQWIHKIKVTHMEAQDCTVGLGLLLLYK